MQEPIQYPYSLKFSIGSILLMIVVMLLVFSNVAAASSRLGWIIYGFFSLVFLFMLIMVVAKRLIPALRGDIALSLDEEGINDYIRDVSIGWNDINGIGLVRGRSAATMLVNLKWESDYGNEIAIPLRWVSGRDDEIYETVQTCFQNSSTDGPGCSSIV